MANQDSERKMKKIKSCKICCDKSSQQSVLECCNAKMCTECYNKLGACPYCRTVYNEEQDQQNKSIITQLYSDEFPTTQDEFNDNHDIQEQITLIMKLNNIVNKAVVEGRIMFPKRETTYNRFKPDKGRIIYGIDGEFAVFNYIWSQLTTEDRVKLQEHDFFTGKNYIINKHIYLRLGMWIEPHTLRALKYRTD